MNLFSIKSIFYEEAETELLILPVVNDKAVACAFRERGSCETHRVPMRCGFHCEEQFHSSFTLFTLPFSVYPFSYGFTFMSAIGHVPHPDLIHFDL